MPDPDLVLITQIQRELAARANPINGAAAQRYMKSTLPCLGVPMPENRRLTKVLERARPPADHHQLVATVGHLWREATYRDHRWAASVLCDTAQARKIRHLDLLGLYEEMIRTGAWWDHVDDTSHRVGDLLAHHRDALTPIMLAWSTDPDRWIRRVSIICQLLHKDHTDVALLTDAIDANVHDNDFFLRKAIGWALRQYARTDPDWVRGFVAERAEVLSGLSQREALKHL